MRNTKIMILLVLLIMFSLALTSCGSAPEEVEEAVDTEEEVIDTDENVIDADTEPETPPEVQANPLLNYELIFSEQAPGPEGVTLSVSAYKAPAGATAVAVMEDFGQWAEEEGWSMLIPSEEIIQVFGMLMPDSFEQDYYKKDNEALLIGVAEAEEEDILVVTVIEGLPLSEFE